MVKITLEKKEYFVEKGTPLSAFLQQNGFAVSHPCGGKGTCGKCTVTVNGRQELSCRYLVEEDIAVELPQKEEILSLAQEGQGESIGFLALDLGTTTLALAEVSAEGEPLAPKTATNPQRRFGADVISRIEYAAKNGVEDLQTVLLEELSALLQGREESALYVAGNTTMLHLLLGEDPSAMGVAPYTPVFLEEQRRKLPLPVAEIITLPGVSAFVGADIVAGLLALEPPAEGKYNLLVDLGTNAEIVLYSEKEALCTAAAAGPCFEGVNITCGMSAVPGAIAVYSEQGYQTVGDRAPIGLCGTGLIDLIATLVRQEIIDETGYLEEDFTVAPGVRLTPGDVRNFQLAKAAVFAAILALMKQAGVGYEQIDRLWLAGGFSASVNRDNAAEVGLLPAALKDKVASAGNSSLRGAARYAAGAALPAFLQNARYVDLSADGIFAELFMENMEFGGKFTSL